MGKMDNNQIYQYVSYQRKIKFIVYGIMALIIGVLYIYFAAGPPDYRWEHENMLNTAKSQIEYLKKDSVKNAERIKNLRENYVVVLEERKRAYEAYFGKFE